jgi:nucleoside-diphosphate-sugar epimerase
MKRVLCTGSAGFIGQAVKEALEKLDIEMVPFDGDNDVRNKFHVEAAMSSGIDGIINLAGILGTAETFGGEYQAAEVNILGALNVMDAALHHDIPMVQIATGHEGQPNPYAITKKCITDLGLARHQYQGQKIAIVRAFHVYGPGQKMCAPHGRSTVRKIIPSFVARALTGMDIEINGDGRQKIDLVYLDDVARSLVDGLTGPFGRVVDAGTGVATTVLDAAKTVRDTCRSQSKIVHRPMRIGEPEDTTVVAANGMCPNPWPYKLEETVQWYRNKLSSVLRATA